MGGVSAATSEGPPNTPTAQIVTGTFHAGVIEPRLAGDGDDFAEQARQAARETRLNIRSAQQVRG
jgi:hypothetical protein